VSSSSTSSSETTPGSPQSSTPGSSTPSAERVRRVAVLTHKGEGAAALARVEQVAAAAGVEIGADSPDLVVVLGGDGTMLEAFQQFLGTGIPVLGVNFGRVGFLTALGAGELEQGLERSFAGDYRVVELPTLDVTIGAEKLSAVNDVVVTSKTPGRMVDLGYAVGGEDLGRLSCDGLVCCTPSGSTGYNLSNGGPVLVWGLDAMAVTFVAAHSLFVRPLVVPRSRELTVTNLTTRTAVTVIRDGREVGALEREERVEVRLGERRSLLATLPENTFFSRYRRNFAS
jgi:NAD+ kinase